MTYRLFHYETRAKALAAAQVLKKAGKVPTLYAHNDMWTVEVMIVEG